MKRPLDKKENLVYNESATPYPVFDEETGYLYLCDGTCRQIICRFHRGQILVWWKKGKTEYPLVLDDFLRGYVQSKK